MPFSSDQIQDLSAPLDPKHVAKRKQMGRELSYIEGWHAIAEANRIFGFDGWTRETVEMREVRPPEWVASSSGKETWRVGFMAKVRVTVEGVIREGIGFGSGAMPDLGDAYESAVKEAETDAMKRALMTFGNPFGLALYDKTQANVSRPYASSAHMKRELLQLEQDLVDVKSDFTLRSLWKQWAEKMLNENWPTPDDAEDETAFRNIVTGMFVKRKEALSSENEDKPQTILEAG